jgi:SpoVT / AbrB like domain.
LRGASTRGPLSAGRRRVGQWREVRELTGLKAGDQVNVTVHPGGSIVVTPIRLLVGADEARNSGKKLIGRNSKLFKRLA